MLRFQVNNLNKILKDCDNQTIDFQSLCKKVEEKLKVKKDLFFEVNFCDDKLMKQLNKKHRKINKTTDVLSFALTENKNNFTNLLGEIYISVPFAQKEAKRLKWNLQKELNLLLVHGVLHLFQYDHFYDNEKKKMFSLQQQILK